MLINGDEDAANNFTRGFYTVGSCIINYLLDRIRLEVEKCSDLQGFIFYHSIGGGTGSGLGSLLYEMLSLYDENIPKFSFPVFPSEKMSTSTVEPYNAILSLKRLVVYNDVCIVLDN